MQCSKVGEPSDPPGEKPGGGVGGRLGSILRKGLCLGKYIAIAGAAITSAPVVIPPLIIFSTLGIAFSVPFGIYFAGYACTEKIMSFLLDPMDTPAAATEDEISGELELEVGEERGNGIWGIEREGELMGEGRVEGEQKAVPLREVVRNASPERGVLAVDPAAVGYPDVAVAIIEHEIVAAPAAGIDVTAVAAAIGEPEIFVEQSSMSSEYASAADDHSLDVTDVESAYSVEHLVSKTMSAAIAPGMEAVGPLGEQVLYTEEKMWEQIAAMRAIVGYTAGPHSSFMEELKALYLFTGVEPPILSEEKYDLVDINDKLRFLKSVIGVK